MMSLATLTFVVPSIPSRPGEALTSMTRGPRLDLRKSTPPILSPKISLVNMHYDKFVEASNQHQKLKDNSSKANLKVASLRTKADDLILDIWNEVEAHFEKLESAEKREQCMQYGLVYVYRKSEKESIKRFMQMSA